jgi:hypothetical protein
VILIAYVRIRKGLGLLWGLPKFKSRFGPADGGSVYSLVSFPSVLTFGVSLGAGVVPPCSLGKSSIGGAAGAVVDERRRLRLIWKEEVECQGEGGHGHKAENAGFWSSGAAG